MASTYVNPAAGAAREALARQAAVANVAGLIPAGGTGATEGAYDTATNRNTTLTTVTEIKTQLNALLAGLRTAGVISS